MDDFKNFLVKAKKQGYAAGDHAIKEEDDFSYSTNFADGDFRFHDNWFGGEPFGGREIVFYKDKPYWMIVYYGVDSQKTPGTLDFLRKALKEMPEDIPVRGPKSLDDGDFRYENNPQGSLERFTGVEKIFYKGEEVFRTDYAGGLVDQKKD